jgi:hypothetical protein
MGGYGEVGVDWCPALLAECLNMFVRDSAGCVLFLKAEGRSRRGTSESTISEDSPVQDAVVPSDRIFFRTNSCRVDYPQRGLLLYRKLIPVTTNPVTSDLTESNIDWL